MGTKCKRYKSSCKKRTHLGLYLSHKSIFTGLQRQFHCYITLFNCTVLRCIQWVKTGIDSYQFIVFIKMYLNESRCCAHCCVFRCKSNALDGWAPHRCWANTLHRTSWLHSHNFLSRQIYCQHLPFFLVRLSFCLFMCCQHNREYNVM